MLSQSVTTMFTLVKTWSSKLLKSTKSSVTLLYLTKLLSKLSWKNKRNKSFQGLRKVKYWKEQLKTSLLTVYSSTWVELTVLSILLTYLGDVLIIQKKSLNWIKN